MITHSDIRSGPLLFTLFSVLSQRKREQKTAKKNVGLSVASIPMEISNSDSAAGLSLLGARTEHSPQPASLEQEVISLFDQLRDRLLGYLLSLGLSPHDGEEIIQETFLFLFQHLQQKKSRKNLRGWIFRVAHNLGLKARARGSRMSGGEHYPMELHADPAPSPEEQVMTGQRRQRLLAVLSALPDQDQHCLCLRAEGLRYREIAEVLGMSLGAVSNSLGRSLARLARAGDR